MLKLLNEPISISKTFYDVEEFDIVFRYGLKFVWHVPYEQ